MITVKQITSGKGYVGRHLAHNDYYSEGEEVTGQWWGEASARLGLEGQDVLPEHYEALRTNRHPFTGAKLRPRNSKVRFHDVVISAPKAFSIAAIIGGDERLIEAFRETVKEVFEELQKRAQVRMHSGDFYNSERTKRTGNIAAAVYFHDSSRHLDPQCHAHILTANLTFDEERNGWFALQPRAMLEDRSIRRFFERRLAQRTALLGYEVRMREQGFGISGITRELEDKFSERMLQRKAFEQRYRNLFGRFPSKKRIEHFIKEGRSEAEARFRDEYRSRFGALPTRQQISEFVRDERTTKMQQISTAEVRRRQLDKLTETESSRLKLVVQSAHQRTHLHEQPSMVSESPSPELATSRPDTVRAKLAGVCSLIRQVADNLVPRSTKGHAEEHQRRVRISRTEILRRMRFGMKVQAACRGYHGALAKTHLRKLARR